MHLGSQANTGVPESDQTFIVDAQSTSYTYNVDPNSRYEVQIGANPSDPCIGSIPTSWSSVQSESCTTPPSSK